MKLFLPVFFLLILSFGVVFGETGSFSVVSGKSYQINYDATFTQILGAQPNKDDQSLLFSIRATEPNATLELTLPRELIDAIKNDGSDDSFIVLVDGTFSSYVEKSSTQTSRTILIQLVPDNKELEIIGTYLAGYDSGSIQQTTPIPAVPKQTNQTLQQNQTSPEKLESSSTKPPTNISKQNLSAQEILSKIFQFNILNSSSSVSNMQIIEYSVIASAILIIIIVVTSSKRSKTRKQIRK